MISVPFYKNRSDNMSCMLAVYRSIIEYFTDEKLSWEELEKLTGYKNGIAAWTIKPLTIMANDNWDIKLIEPFNYKKYYKSGEPYLDEIFTLKEKRWFLANSNILQMKDYIPEFLKNVHHEMRNPGLKDIDDLLSENRLVSVVVNSKSLNGKDGYVSHMVLVLSKQKDDYVFHDPGLPGKAYRKEPGEVLLKAMGNPSDITGFKLK